MMGLKEETMSLSARESQTGNGGVSTPPKQTRRRRCRVIVLCILLLLLALIVVGFILGMTVFKVKEARTQVVSASLEGVAPRVSFPAIKLELNITLNLTLMVQNPNHASFEGRQGEGVLLYKGDTVGYTQIDPGLIRAKAASTLLCLLTLQVDKFADSGLASLVSDISSGQLVLETKTKIPGRVTFLGFYHKHIVSTSDCQIVIAIPDLNIKSQDCKHHK